MQSQAGAREKAIDVVASTFLYRTARLTRLLAAAGDRQLSRTEAGLLVTLLDGPRRVSDLAESEALAQPTVSVLVDTLSRRGLVERERDQTDRRVVLVVLTAPGRATIEAARSHFRGVMREAVARLSQDELTQLARASDIIEGLIQHLRQPV